MHGHALDIHELTIARYHAALRQGHTSAADLVSAYLAQIRQHNPTLNAIITVNPDALTEAHKRDTERVQYCQTQTPVPALHGVPIILKDTYTTASLRTTSGIQALETLQTATNAAVVDALLAQGAIILAKANLHEFSLQGITTSSLQGQTLNPYDPTRTPGGSSGGTAAALAANMGLVGCGGDTMNSLRSPASACGIVGFRPTHGQVSRRGIVPVTETQDVAGPLGRSVADVRVLFEVMRGEDVLDPATVNALRGHRTAPRPRQRQRQRVGFLRDYFGDANTADGATVNRVVSDALHRVQRGSDVEFVELPPVPDWDIAMLLATADTQAFEFREAFDAFLQRVEHTPHRSLASIVASGQYHRDAVTPALYQTLQADGEFSTSSAEYQRRRQRIDALKRSVEHVYARHGLDAVVYPHQRQLVAPVGSMVQPGRNGLLAALTGRPAICLPAGCSPPSSTAPMGIPVGVELMGRAWQDDELLDLAERFESVIQGRRVPAGY
ncbi:amidase signature domain-containing protein [Aspergillus ambiguus]|uniref:amidase n=1 Tax=Aspergillus ambiguus TaxID=176160 RepID=UPI003CCD97D5